MQATRTPAVALVGNPNTGKTTLFNALSGMNQRVGNYPGVTVETIKGRLRCHDQAIDLIDLPGTYSLAPRSPDEMVAVDVLLGQAPGESRPDAVIAIVDASNLERNLYLTTQVLELGVPVVLALNMMDVAESQGLRIDVPQLSRRLGVPIVPLQANRRLGLEDLKQAVQDALARASCPGGPAFPEAFQREVDALAATLDCPGAEFLARRALLDIGGHTEKRLAEQHGPRLAQQIQAARARLHDAGCAVPAVEARTRYAWIRAAVAPCVQRPAQRVVSWTDRLDRVLTHRVWGTLIFLLIMFLMFQAIFTWYLPAKDLMTAGQGWLTGLVESSMDPGPLRALLTEGVIAGVGGVLTFLPQILILFAFIAVLEDCGYMARAAFLMDRQMAGAGLNGRSFIPLLSSMACAVPGIMSARVIENPRDRLATILVAPLMSCSARLPVYLLLTSAFLTPRGDASWLEHLVPGLTLFGLYALGLVLAPLMALLFKRTLLRGETPVFVLEMPLYKVPSPLAVLRRAVDAGVMFVRRAGTVILASMILIWALLYFPHVDAGGRSYEERLAQLEEQREALGEDADPAAAEELDASKSRLLSEWKSRSYLGQIGHALEPVVAPLGWDWRIGTAALASFPAREVMVGTLAILFSQPEEEDQDKLRASLGASMQQATWEHDSSRPLFTVPVALSVLVFFALCCQCASTLAVIRRETNSWFWPAFTFVYMTLLAYVGALVVYQVGRLLI